MKADGGVPIAVKVVGDAASWMDWANFSVALVALFVSGLSFIIALTQYRRAERAEAGQRVAYIQALRVLIETVQGHTEEAIDQSLDVADWRKRIGAWRAVAQALFARAPHPELMLTVDRLTAAIDEAQAAGAGPTVLTRFLEVTHDLTRVVNGSGAPAGYSRSKQAWFNEILRIYRRA